MNDCDNCHKDFCDCTKQNVKIAKPMKDTDLMPFGVHSGKTMANVPATYLIWLYDTGKCYGKVKSYIEYNMDSLKQEVKFKKR